MEVLIKKLVLVLLLGVSLFLSSLSFADESSVEFDYQTIRGQYRAAGGTYYPRVVGIPADMYDTIEEGIQQRALANSEIQRILYSGSDADRAQLMRQLPELKVFLGINDQGKLAEKRGYHAGFVSELMGKVHSAHLGRLYGPDVWLVRPVGADDSVSPRLVIGEENGGNPGGADRLRALTKIFHSDSTFGTPPNNYQFHQRMIDHVKKLGAFFKPEMFNGRKPVIVYYTEDSITKGPVKVNWQGESLTINAYNPKPKELIDDIRNEMARLGVIWLSAVDKQDKSRIFVKDNTLFVKVNVNGKSQIRPVDILYTRLDVEMSDSTYDPQVKRNKLAHRQDMTETGKLIGIPGLVEAWLKGQNPSDSKEKGFLWVNGMTSMLTTNKIWPAMVDSYIERVLGQKVKLPLLETVTFYTADGKFDEDKFERHWDRANEYVIKMTLGQGGKQVEFPHLMDDAEKREAKIRVLEALKLNPYSYVLQLRSELNKVKVDYNGKLSSKIGLFHDFRLISFISPRLVTSMKQILIRFSQALKINVSQNGSMAVGARSNEVYQVEPTKPRSVSNSVYQCISNFNF